MNIAMFVDKFNSVQNKCDEHVLHHIINSLDEETIDALIDSCDDGFSDVCRYLIWKKRHMTLPVDAFHKNEPVQQLLQWYLDAKSKKVGYARKQLCRSFDFLSFEDQCTIIEAFMNRKNVSEIVFCCKHLSNDAFWKDEYLSVLQEKLDCLITENVRSAYPVVKLYATRSSQQDIERVLHILDRNELKKSIFRMTQYDLLTPLLIACDKLPDEILKNNTLTVVDYVYVMARKGLKVSEETAAAALKEASTGEYDIQSTVNVVVRSIAKMGYYDMLFEYGMKHKEKEIAF